MIGPGFPQVRAKRRPYKPAIQPRGEGLFGGFNIEVMRDDPRFAWARARSIYQPLRRGRHRPRDGAIKTCGLFAYRYSSRPESVMDEKPY